MHYRRVKQKGGSFFFTLVTYHRQKIFVHGVHDIKMGEDVLTGVGRAGNVAYKLHNGGGHGSERTAGRRKTGDRA